MKIGVVFFHKNILNIYKKRWILESANSILNQTFKDFSIYEINYGEDDFSLSSLVDFKDFKHIFYNTNLINYSEAQNFILKKTIEDGCDYVFNTNLDDISYLNRFETQINYAINNKVDILSSDMEYVKEDKEVDVVTYKLEFWKYNTKEKIKEQ